MFEKLALHITCWLEKYKVIKQDEIVVVKWGIKNILDTIFNVTTFLIIGILMGMITETVFFTIGYIPLRSYAWGYHAKTPFRRWIVSSLILFIAMNMICSLKNFPFAFVVLAVISVFIVYADAAEPSARGFRAISPHNKSHFVGKEIQIHTFPLTTYGKCSVKKSLPDMESNRLLSAITLTVWRKSCVCRLRNHICTELQPHPIRFDSHGR